ncbi:MAG: MOSC domain-containing protein [Myxococcales bacterium]|nr:MAG: MOSC domain-containing protein [Myxococcales bacterium]
MNSGVVEAICVSERKGVKKQAVPAARIQRGHGIVGDAHAGTWHRQVSLLEAEKIERMRGKGLDLKHGDFGENIVVRGFDLFALAIGRRFRVGEDVVLQVTQYGKECHTRCAIYHQTGDCIMPTDGVFARVVRGGELKPGDRLFVDPAFDRLRIGVLTLSDRGARGEREDVSGPLLARLLAEPLKADIVEAVVLPDERAELEARLIELCDVKVCDLVVTTGGTGLSPRDVTPEATLAVIDRQAPGMAEAVRAEGMKHTPRAMLSRAVCGLRGQTLIVNLSGSPKAVEQQLGALLPVLPHALETASGLPQDCGR